MNKNTPIYQSTKMKLNDITTYIEKFQEHSLELNELFINDQILITNHFFNDKLNIEIYWKANEYIYSFTNYSNLKGLCDLNQNKVIKPVFYNILCYSQMNKNISKQDYYFEEYSCSEPSELNDDFFESLQKQICNYTNFEGYLNNKAKGEPQ